MSGFLGEQEIDPAIRELSVPSKPEPQFLYYRYIVGLFPRCDILPMRHQPFSKSESRNAFSRGSPWGIRKQGGGRCP